MIPLLSKKFVGEEYLCRKDFLGISSKSQQQCSKRALHRFGWVHGKNGERDTKEEKMCAKKWRDLGARKISVAFLEYMCQVWLHTDLLNTVR